MIKLIRIDDRLVHGQVALTWTPALGADCLLVANDKTAKDEFQKMTLQLAKPAGAKLLVKTVADSISWLQDPKSSALKVLVLVNAVADAAALVNAIAAVTSINFGGLRTRPGARPVSKAVSLTDEDILTVKELEAKGIELEVRQVPTDTKQMLAALL